MEQQAAAAWGVRGVRGSKGGKGGKEWKGAVPHGVPPYGSGHHDKGDSGCDEVVYQPYPPASGLYHIGYVSQGECVLHHGAYERHLVLMRGTCMEQLVKVSQKTICRENSLPAPHMKTAAV